MKYDPIPAEDEELAHKLLSYLKATGLRLGLIINFKVLVLKDGIKRVVR